MVPRLNSAVNIRPRRTSRSACAGPSSLRPLPRGLPPTTQGPKSRKTSYTPRRPPRKASANFDYSIGKERGTLAVEKAILAAYHRVDKERASPRGFGNHGGVPPTQLRSPPLRTSILDEKKVQATCPSTLACQAPRSWALTRLIATDQEPNASARFRFLNPRNAWMQQGTDRSQRADDRRLGLLSAQGPQVS